MGDRWGAAFVRIGWQASFGLDGSFAPDWVAGITGIRKVHCPSGAMGWRLWVLDVTTDLDIPTFVALAHSGDASRFCIGFGCHFDARLGVKRALTELNQLFDLERQQAAPWDVKAMADPQYLFPDNALPARVYADFAEVQHVDLRDDIATCVQRAQRANLEVLVLNQTRPGVGLAVAMVAVPGLRHFWPRFGPGRIDPSTLTSSATSQLSPMKLVRRLGWPGLDPSSPDTGRSGPHGSRRFTRPS